MVLYRTVLDSPGVPVLRISKLTDYATVILAQLAAADGARRTAAEVAADAGLAAPTVAKVLKELQRAGLVSSSRGSRGGYTLARDAALITAADIIDAVEGPVALTECASHENHCGLEKSCRVSSSWQRVSLAIRGALAEVTLRQLIGMEPVAAPSLKIAPGAELPIVWRARA
jgi:FeS assembly SUF system regulator